EEIVERNRNEGHAALLRRREHVVERLADPARDQVCLQVGVEALLDCGDIRETRLPERGIVDDRTVVGDFPGVPEQGLRLERRENVGVIDVRLEDVRNGAEVETRQYQRSWSTDHGYQRAH